MTLCLIQVEKRQVAFKRYRDVFPSRLKVIVDILPGLKPPGVGEKSGVSSRGTSGTASNKTEHLEHETSIHQAELEAAAATAE